MFFYPAFFKALAPLSFFKKRTGQKSFNEFQKLIYSVCQGFGLLRY